MSIRVLEIAGIDAPRAVVRLVCRARPDFRRNLKHAMSSAVNIRLPTHSTAARSAMAARHPSLWLLTLILPERFVAVQPLLQRNFPALPRHPLSAPSSLMLQRCPQTACCQIARHELHPIGQPDPAQIPVQG